MPTRENIRLIVRTLLGELCSTFSLNDTSLTNGPNLKCFHINVPHNAPYKNCINGSAPLNTRTTRALDKKSFKHLVQIENNFTGFFPCDTLF